MPRVTSASQARAFSVYAPHLWNSLPVSVRRFADFSAVQSASLAAPDTFSSVAVSASGTALTTHLTSFKRNLKTYLFDASLSVATSFCVLSFFPAPLSCGWSCLLLLYGAGLQ